VTLIKELYREMVEQGFYTPHIRTTYKGERKPKHDLAAGTFDVRIKIVMQMDVCLQPPTKVDFINALGFIQPLKGEDELDPILPALTREWCQMVAEKIAESCYHNRCSKLTTPQFALVQKCYKQFP